MFAPETTFGLPVSPTRANECGVRKTLCRTTPISCLISPPSNYAAWEHVAAELMASTSEFAAPRCPRCRQPVHYRRRLAKPPPKPSPSWTHSFLGCAVRKSDFPGTSLNLRARRTRPSNCIPTDLVRQAARRFGEISFDQAPQTPAELPVLLTA